MGDETSGRANGQTDITFPFCVHLMQQVQSDLESGGTQFRLIEGHPYLRVLVNHIHRKYDRAREATLRGSDNGCHVLKSRGFPLPAADVCWGFAAASMFFL